jgi:alpha-glucoside transport system substrate-binding protein
MVPLEDVVPLNQYPQIWQDLGALDGTVYGAFFKADTKSLVWYSPIIFQAQGWETPESWDEMQSLMDTMTEADASPLSCGMESGEATGWVASDWIQDFLLRTEGADFVEQWVDREIPWTDPAIADAWQRWKDICGSEEYTVGGAQGTLNTTFQDSIRLVFQEPPEAYMVRQATFASSIIADSFPELEPVDDYTFFMFPQLSEEIGAPMQGAADVMAMHNEDNEAAAAMMSYMFSAPAQRALAELGWGLSANGEITADDYGSELQGKAAEMMNDAPAFSFDADDRMPGGLQTAYWQGIVDYLTGGDLDTILQNLEETAVEAYEE